MPEESAGITQAQLDAAVKAAVESSLRAPAPSPRQMAEANRKWRKENTRFSTVPKNRVKPMVEVPNPPQVSNDKSSPVGEFGKGARTSTPFILPPGFAGAVLRHDGTGPYWEAPEDC